MIRTDLRALLTRTGWQDETVLGMALYWLQAKGMEDAFVAHLLELEEEEWEPNPYVLCARCGTTLPMDDARIHVGTPGWVCPTCLTERT